MEKDSGASACMGGFSTSSDHQGKYILYRFVDTLVYANLSKNVK